MIRRQLGQSFVDEVYHDETSFVVLSPKISREKDRKYNNNGLDITSHTIKIQNETETKTKWFSQKKLKDDRNHPSLTSLSLSLTHSLSLFLSLSLSFSLSLFLSLSLSLCLSVSLPLSLSLSLSISFSLSLCLSPSFSLSLYTCQ